MTTKELAEYIKMNEKTVLKMAQRGELPGVKIGNQWRFRLETIDKYLQNEIPHSSNRDLDSVIKTADDIIPLSRLADERCIKLDSKAKTPDEVLLDLVTMAKEIGLSDSKEKLLSELQKRERMLSTAIGNKVAIPHPRHPSRELFKETKVIFLRTRNGIEFGAPDGQFVYLFFMTCAPNEFSHLRLLAKISKLLRSPDTIEKLLYLGDRSQIIQVFLEFDRNHLFPIIKEG